MIVGRCIHGAPVTQCCIKCLALLPHRIPCSTPGCDSEPKLGETFCKACIAERVNTSMKQETIAVPAELVRELKAELARVLPQKWTDGELTTAARSIRSLVNSIPDPPKPDVVEECARVAWDSHVSDNLGTGRAFADVTGDARAQAIAHAARVIRQYRAMGCPELDE